MCRQIDERIEYQWNAIDTNDAVRHANVEQTFGFRQSDRRRDEPIFDGPFLFEARAGEELHGRIGCNGVDALTVVRGGDTHVPELLGDDFGFSRSYGRMNER